MTTTGRAPAPFTNEDYAARMRRVVADAARAGLDGLLVTPGPTWSGSPATSPRRSPSG